MKQDIHAYWKGDYPVRFYPALILMIVLIISAAGCGTKDEGTIVYGSTWRQDNVNGFGSTNNLHAPSMIIFQETLYVSTYNPATGATIQEKDGTNWVQVNIDGFGDSNNVDIRSMVVLNNELYAATTNGNGCQVWKWDGTNAWTQVTTTAGFESANNSSVNCMVVLNGALFAGTENTGGCQVWKYDAGAWTKINVNGFGLPDNIAVDSISAYANTIIAGVRNKNGCHIYRSPGGGGLWTEIRSNDSFGNINNISVTAMGIHNANLFCGLENSVTGSQVWMWNTLSWTQMDSAGFGYYSNRKICSIQSIGGNLYATTMNTVTGGQIWNYTLNGWVTYGQNGFGTAANYALHSLVSNGGVLTAGVDNDGGCRVYSYR
ncbi:MAG: hypothetical protein M1269_11445 [Chloroflexi bacterium]|nr:hypothetical protein [Chloroflexota bacterium]